MKFTTSNLSLIHFVYKTSFKASKPVLDYNIAFRIYGCKCNKGYFVVKKLFKMLVLKLNLIQE